MAHEVISVSAKRVVYRGYVTLNGRTTLELEVYRNTRHVRDHNRWLFYRTSNGSREGFKYADDAMAHGTRLNPKIEWRKEFEPVPR
jgi:hypothetical protein